MIEKIEDILESYVIQNTISSFDIKEIAIKINELFKSSTK